MSRVALIGATDPEQVWPGRAVINEAGARLATNLLLDLEDPAPEDGDDGPTTPDYCSLENWPRQGEPRRDLLAEYLTHARAAGFDVEAGFLAVLQDFIAGSAQGSKPDIGSYFEMFGWDEIDKAPFRTRKEAP